jgi:hypothetical protein
MGRVMSGRLAIGALLLLVGCSSSPTKGGPASSSGPSSSAAPIASLAPGSRAAIRDNTAKSPYSSGVGLEARALVTKVAQGDGFPLALRFVREARADGSDPWEHLQLDGDAVMRSVRLEIELPGGERRTLELADDSAAQASPTSPRWWAPVVTIDKTGLRVGDIPRAWKTPADDVFAATGAVSITVTATFEAGPEPPVVLTTGKLGFEVAAPSDTFKRMVDIERAASEAARSAWNAKSIPIPREPTIDDVDGNLAVRFNRANGGGRTNYDDELLEVWVDRAGKVLATDGYTHFTCVAEGTPIATPHGPVAVERLALGAEVLAFDVEAGTPAVAKVLRIDRERAPSVVALGDLLVTPGHPVWAADRWTPAAEVEPGMRLLGPTRADLAAAPVTIATPHVVFDIGVTAPHTYFAAGVLLHNKAAHVPLGGAGRPWGPLFFRHAAK